MIMRSTLHQPRAKHLLRAMDVRFRRENRASSLKPLPMVRLARERLSTALQAGWLLL